jgi:hypothetical protein
MRNGNLFEQQRKRFLSGGQSLNDSKSSNSGQAPAAISPMLPGTDLISLSTSGISGGKRNPLNNRRGFDELPLQGFQNLHHPSATAVAHP